MPKKLYIYNIHTYVYLLLMYRCKKRFNRTSISFVFYYIILFRAMRAFIFFFSITIIVSLAKYSALTEFLNRVFDPMYLSPLYNRIFFLFLYLQCFLRSSLWYRVV